MVRESASQLTFGSLQCPWAARWIWTASRGNALPLTLLLTCRTPPESKWEVSRKHGALLWIHTAVRSICATPRPFTLLKEVALLTSSRSCSDEPEALHLRIFIWIFKLFKTLLMESESVTIPVLQVKLTLDPVLSLNRLQELIDMEGPYTASGKTISLNCILTQIRLIDCVQSELQI